MRYTFILITLLLTACGPASSPADLKKASQAPAPEAPAADTAPTGPTTCIDGALYETYEASGGKFLVFKDGKSVPC